ncbi:MFS transporter [Apibacter raozihei]|uniref:MFS transporter n=1 Tax=Apibacter raozihei TaxID=2500547 RepID=UPI000FE34E41|nr:MFS transporter [Apibacter raozihei]
MNDTKVSNTLGPYLVLTFVFFILGFMTTINGQCQGPLKILFLDQAGELKNTLTNLISFCFFSGFAISSLISSKWINRHGYKTPLLRGLVLMVIALLVTCLSSWVAENYSQYVINIGDGKVPYGFFIFILGSFLLGSSVSLVQTVIIPYVSAYVIPNTSTLQRVNITCAANSFGTTIAPFFVTAVIFGGAAMNDFNAGQLMVPFLLIALCIASTRIIVGRIALPDIKNTRIDKEDNKQRNIWSFSHLKWGVVAIFFYVGAEMGVGTNVNLHAMELERTGSGLAFFGKTHLMVGNIDLGIPALLATFYWGGMMIGRIISGLFNNISPRLQLMIATVVAALLTLIAIITNNLWILVSVGLCHSVMWGCIFTLAVKDLGKYTSKASGVFMMGVFGGAVFPVLQGFLADFWGSWQWTWGLIIICELVMFWYAVYGSKIKEKPITADNNI